MASSEKTDIATLRATAVVALLCCCTGGCAGMDGAESESSGENENVGEAQDAVLGWGDVYTAACSAPQNAAVQPAVSKIVTRARRAARSVAFRQCVIKAVLDGVDFDYYNGGPTDLGHSTGPYVPCGNPDCPCGTAGCVVPDGGASSCMFDSLYQESINRQLARILTHNVAEYSIAHDCLVPLPGGAAGNSQGFDTVNKREQFRWKRYNPTGDGPMSAIVWHETLHNHWYHHSETNEGTEEQCGYENGSTDYDAWRAATAIVGGCMSEVLEASFDLCYGDDWYALTPCTSDELYVVKGVADYASSGCECVPGPFDNQNEAGDRFGRTTAVGNFNGDEYDDLAVAAIGENNKSGVIYIYRGSPVGLAFWKRIAPADIVVYDYDVSHEFALGAESFDRMGRALAAGDFNHDGDDDLVIGIPHEALGDEAFCGGGDCGYVVLVPGSPSGLDLADAQGLRQSATPNESNDEFGFALAVGDFDADGVEDLLVGAPGENGDVGAVYAFEGRGGAAPARRLVAAWDAIWQSDGGYANEVGDRFGAAIAAGNFQTNDSAAEAVIGATGEEAGQGYIFVAEVVSSVWDITDASGNPNGAVPGGFGSAIAIADLRGSTALDVAVGAPGEASAAGAVYIFMGSSTDLDYVQRLTTAAGAAEAGDHFGATLAAGKLLSGTKATLLVGVPEERWGSGSPGEGYVEVWQGGTLVTYRTYLRQDALFDCTDTASGYCAEIFPSNDTLLPPEGLGSDRFGTSLAIGNFIGVQNNVVVGAHYDTTGLVSPTSSGAVFVFNRDMNDIMKIDQVTQRWGDNWVVNWP